MKSKVLALLLCCMLLASSMLVSAATYTDVAETHDRYTAIDMLSSMDIITGFPDGSFKPENPVTRAQMAALITRMFNLGDSQVTQAPFSDVAVDYWAASNIVAAKNRGIINGFPDGTYGPEKSVTYEQAIKMIVCALNYGTAAEAQGGYPGGYITQASKLNIMKNASSGHKDPAPRGIIAQLLYNSLSVEMLEPVVNPDGTIDYVKPSVGGNTIGEQFLKTKTLTNATVVRTPKVNMEPGVSAIQNVNEDAMFVKASDGSYVKIKVGQNTAAFDYVGQLVDITYKEDGSVGEEKVLTNISRSTSVRIYENIKLSNVVSLDNGMLEYYTDKANDRTAKIQFAGTPKVLYNERLDANGIQTINNDLFSVVNHTYTNGVISVYVGGSSTLVKAKAYKNYVVESVVPNEQKITVKGSVVGGTPQSNISITIPYKDAYVNETVIKKGTFDYATGKAASNANKLSGYSGIAKGNIIAVASNELDASNKYFEVLVSSNTVNGVVNEMITDDATGRMTIKVGSSANSMLLSADLDRYEMSGTVQADMNAKFHLDPFGEIGYISNIHTQDVKVGIPVSVTTGGSGFERMTQLEIYNVDTGSVETLRFRDDEGQNDPRAVVLKDGSGNLIKDSLFKYTLKNGQIETLEIVGAGTDDYTYVAAKSTANEVNNIKKTSSTKITFDGKEITYNSSATKLIFIGSTRDTGKVTPKTGTMVTNTEYEGKVYQLNKKKTGTNYNLQYVILRPLETITKDSPTYIVDTVGGTVSAGDIQTVTVKAYPFIGTSKSGNASAATEIVMTAQVATALALKKGDVFTYYNIPSTSSTDTVKVDIDTLRNVYILARASEIANGTYPTAGYVQKIDNMEDAGGYSAAYRFLGIQNNTSNLVAPDVSGVYTYYMGVPMAYITDTDGVERTLRIAKDASNDMPILAGDIADISVLEGDLDNSDNFYDYDLASLTNIYVYDASATETEKLLQIKGKDQVRAYLEGLQTIENNASNTEKRHDTLFVRTYNYDSGNTFYNLYIIKDNRTVNP